MKDTVLITGCSKGVGKTTAELLSKTYNVIALSRKNNIFDSENIDPYQIDISNKEERIRLFEYCSSKNIVALINNATASLGNSLLLNDNEENLNETLMVNINAPLELARMFAPRIINNKGNIINITSIAAHHPNRNSGHYIIAKSALSSLSKVLRLETVGSGLSVTEIVPGMINSNGHNPNALDPNDIAETIRWILSLPKHVNIDYIQIMHTSNGI